jgi:leucyl/phenylalanyl-tRNA--protein transferase
MRTITWLAPNDGGEWFPPLDHALEEPDGLLAAGGDLTTARILAAYRRGIFPWYAPGQPVLWWCPDPREVLFPDEFRRARSLAKTIRNRGFVVTFDQAFEPVMRACAAPRRAGGATWITAQMLGAYCELHRQGFAHSVEVWDQASLVGGLYGVQIGAAFFGESMFSHSRDASKVALAQLVDRARACDLAVIDCQVASQHLRSLGSRAIARAEFAKLTAAAVAAPTAALFTV